MFNSKIDSDKFYGIQLDESRRRTSSVNLYVPDTPSVQSALRLSTAFETFWMNTLA